LKEVLSVESRHFLNTYFPTIPINTMPPSRYTASKRFLSLRFPHQNILPISLFSLTGYLLHALHNCDKKSINHLTPELNPSAQRCLPRFLVVILISKGLTARRIYKSFGVKGLICRGYHFWYRKNKNYCTKC
jgi:hypothetical protein